MLRGVEIYYGHGIQRAPAARTRFGTPQQRLVLGVTHIDDDTFAELLTDLGTRYTPAAYRLLGRVDGGYNCNDFADELCQLLCGVGVPSHITSLPAEVLATPFGQSMLPMLAPLQAGLGAAQEGYAEELGVAPGRQLADERLPAEHQAAERQAAAHREAAPSHAQTRGA